MELGKAYLDSDVVSGQFYVKGRKVQFTDDDQEIPNLKLNILTLATTCANPEPCMLEVFLVQ